MQQDLHPADGGCRTQVGIITGLASTSYARFVLRNAWDWLAEKKKLKYLNKKRGVLSFTFPINYFTCYYICSPTRYTKCFNV